MITLFMVSSPQLATIVDHYLYSLSANMSILFSCLSKILMWHNLGIMRSNSKASFAREVYEETYVKLVNLQVFDYIKITLFERKVTASDYPYPESYILLYIGHIDSLDPFVGKHETQDRKLFTPAEAEKLT